VQLKVLTTPNTMEVVKGAAEDVNHTVKGTVDVTYEEGLMQTSSRSRLVKSVNSKLKRRRPTF